MARTTAANVRTIIDADASVSLDPFIEIAAELVTENCTAAGWAAATGEEVASFGVEYGATRLELIERYLAAHFYAIYDRPTQSEGAAGITATYIGKTGENLSATLHGQQAMLLDTAGRLAALNKGVADGASTARRQAAVGITYLGRASA